MMAVQFADHAVKNEDLSNYLGFAEVVLFNVSLRNRSLGD